MKRRVDLFGCHPRDGLGAVRHLPAVLRHHRLDLRQDRLGSSRRSPNWAMLLGVTWQRGDPARSLRKFTGDGSRTSVPVSCSRADKRWKRASLAQHGRYHENRGRYENDCGDHQHRPTPARLKIRLAFYRPHCIGEAGFIRELWLSTRTSLGDRIWHICRFGVGLFRCGGRVEPRGFILRRPGLDIASRLSRRLIWLCGHHGSPWQPNFDLPQRFQSAPDLLNSHLIC